MRILILLLSLVLAPSAVAKDEVYKWVDDKGVVHYTDKPPSENAQPAKLPPLQTYKGGTAPDLRRYDKPAQNGKPAGLAQVDLVTPGHDETFRGGERTVPVAVVVTPPLAADQRLIYMLDGKPASTPTTDTSYAFTNVDRGSHTASAMLVDMAGNEIASSTSVTFHMKLPVQGQAQKLQPKPQKPPPKPPKP
jgi:hypothetical protein